MRHLTTIAVVFIISTISFANSGRIPEYPIKKVPQARIMPADPMEDYTPSVISEYKMQNIWENMTTRLKGKDCYRRAHIWAYNMYDFYGVKSMKIFIHYTNKFNRELDGAAKMSRRGLKGILDYRTYKMLGYNKTWDYHVAPLVQLRNGDYRVLDKELILAYDARFPYTDDEAWDLKKRPATIEEWLDGLMVRGELLWKARKLMLERDMKRASGAYYNQLRAKYIELGMDKNNQIDIKCHRADSIAEVDLNHDTAYCFYTIAPMYYYNEMDLRALAFGNTNQNYAMPVRPETYTEENYLNGRNYVARRWIYAELSDAKKEFKWGAAGDFSSRIKKVNY